MNIVNEHVEDYIRDLVIEADDYFLELEQFAEERHVPIIHKEVKNLLEFVVKSTQSVNILELGTAIGYSASVFARAMDGKGRIVSIERREEYHNLAKENVKKLGYETEFDFILDDAEKALENMTEQFDLIFLDAAKGHYQLFFDLCEKLLKPGGVIISDNVLYKGMTASDLYVLRRKKTIVKRMREYLNQLVNNKHYVTTILPMSDGIALSYHKGGKNE